MYNNWLPLGIDVLAAILDVVVTEGVTMPVCSVVMWDVVETEDVAVVVAMLDDVIAITKSKNTGVSIIIQICICNIFTPHFKSKL